MSSLSAALAKTSLQICLLKQPSQIMWIHFLKYSKRRGQANAQCFSLIRIDASYHHLVLQVICHQIQFKFIASNWRMQPFSLVKFTISTPNQLWWKKSLNFAMKMELRLAWHYLLSMQFLKYSLKSKLSFPIQIFFSETKRKLNSLAWTLDGNAVSKKLAPNLLLLIRSINLGQG